MQAQAEAAALKRAKSVTASAKLRLCWDVCKPDSPLLVRPKGKGLTLSHCLCLTLPHCLCLVFSLSPHRRQVLAALASAGVAWLSIKISKQFGSLASMVSAAGSGGGAGPTIAELRPAAAALVGLYVAQS